MRFKAKLALEQVQLLCNLIGPISRLSGSASSSSDGAGGLLLGSSTMGIGGGGTVIYLDPERMRISARGGTGGGGGSDGDGIACFSELTTRGGIFLEHRIESAAKDVILFEIDLAQLRLALQSVLAGGGGRGRKRSSPQALHNSSAADGGTDEFVGSLAAPSVIVMKLAKRNGGLPCLCLDASCAGGSVEVHHAIPVRIMRADEMQYHLPPRISMPDVQLELPPDRPLKTVAERLRTISPHVFIEGSMAGELTLRIDGDGASIRTFYNKLVPRFEDLKSAPEGEQDENDFPARCTLKVDSKKLNACLHWQGTMVLGRSVEKAVLCMVENEMLVLHCMLNPGEIGFFTYYVPVHFLSPDQID
uniref:Checkpoint protein n=1 Tax=Trieres chinensis TaxID=1514140 RepID=A0A7S2A7M3_TRICV|mmetsp:Transcript_5579/g.11617  ORF Transcript_5579/g.11617 Transcript_5579/m.11617 type:complete len:361 (+) Transcript_5579:133-1215(+)